ncbi:phosphoribosyltransferase [Brucella anthropi]|uniref:phosphoribosyltransferase n=1 Tax=Brucella anthropi TaxID=529 RepID=UPI00215888A2|nr:phosphoribosyltransferase [Brucella anthropi]MCR8493913.1 phosphoribosyltransferase [Brucella anthropi]
MMIYYNMVAGWMGFPHLSISNGLTYSYAIAYRLKDKTSENWTARFIRFKDKNNKAEWGGATVFYEAVPALIKHLGVDPKRTAFIPALSSGETKADPNRSIPWIAKECARICGAQYTDAALSKNVHQKIHSIYSADGRSAELDKAKYQSTKIDADHVFVFDDFITRGDTLSRIALAVLAANPKCKVYGIALAKAESVAFCPNPDNDHVPARWDDLWKQGEQEHDAKFKKG